MSCCDSGKLSDFYDLINISDSLLIDLTDVFLDPVSNYGDDIIAFAISYQLPDCIFFYRNKSNSKTLPMKDTDLYQSQTWHRPDALPTRKLLGEHRPPATIYRFTDHHQN